MSLEEWVGVGIPDEIVEQAISWVTILDSDDATLEQQVEFYQWLEEDSIHRWAFEELSEFWAKAQLSKEHIALLEDNSITNINELRTFSANDNLPTAKYPIYEITSLALIVVGLAIGLIF
ncbi:FecR/PupR family sigma factor regulator [Colwelliaceae bacterium BS250]